MYDCGPADGRIEEAEHSKIIEVGDLCFYFLRTEGTKEPNSLIAVTEVTPDSNKNPLLFPGEFFGAGSIGEVKDSRVYARELRNLRGFQNEAIVASKYARYDRNMKWIKLIDPSNIVIKMKEEYMSKQNQTDGRVSPSISTMMEERLINPFLRLSSDNHFVQVAESADDHVILEKFKAFEKSQNSQL